MAEKRDVARLEITANYYNDEGNLATITTVRYLIMTSAQSAIAQKAIANALCDLGIKAE